MASRKTLLAWMGLGCAVGLATTASITWLIERGKASQSNYLTPAIARIPGAAEKAFATALADARAHGWNAPVAATTVAMAANDPAPLPSPLPLPAPADKRSAPSVDVPGKSERHHPPQPALETPPPLPTPAAPPIPVPTDAPAVPPLAIPEPAPAAPPPAPGAVASPVPPPLPTEVSVPPPPDDLKPIAQALGEPLPPLPMKPAEKPSAHAHGNKAETAPAQIPAKPAEAIGDMSTKQAEAASQAPKSDIQPVSLTTPAPAAPAVPAATPDQTGTPLPPLESITPLPIQKASAEPPLAPAPGPVQSYQVRAGGETMRDIARRTLGGEDRWAEVHRLNPALRADQVIDEGATVKLPADACIHEDEAVQPLPSMWPKAMPQKPKAALPLTGTFAANLDDKKALLLPRAIRDQFGNCETLLISPGSDQCLWLTNQTHLDRLSDRLERSPAQEADVRTFRRLYYAQTEKASVGDDGRVTVPDRLMQFAGLHQEVILVGIDDHFELWDAASWRRYTQQKSAATRAAMAERN
jgi:MraZ protein